MSARLVLRAIELDLPTSEKMVLMVLANFASDDGGSCHPSMTLIAGRAGMTSRNAVRMVAALRKRGLIDVANSGRGSQNRYYLRHNSPAWEALKTTNSEAREARILAKTSDAMSPDNARTSDNLSPEPVTPCPPTSDTMSPEPVTPCHTNLSGNQSRSCHEPVNAHAREADLNDPEPDRKARPAFALPDWLPADAWNGWIEMRKKKKAPPTERACRLAVRQLEKLWDAGHDPGAVLDQSTMRGWTGLFPLKENLQNGNASNRPAGKPQYRRNPGFEMLRDAIVEERAQRAAADADAQADHLVTVDPLPLPARH